MKEIMTQFPLRLRVSLMDQVKESAEKNGRSIVQELRELIAKGLKN